ncbi:hypothetical protein C0992_008983, partial [Termitomyces sp. T32_za158]
MDPLDAPIELQLFDGQPTQSGPITHHHVDAITLQNGISFPVDLLVTQLSRATPIILGLPWLREANPDVNWRSMTMTFDTGDERLAASISLRSRHNPSVEEVPDEDSPLLPAPLFLTDTGTGIIPPSNTNSDLSCLKTDENPDSPPSNVNPDLSRSKTSKNPDISPSHTNPDLSCSKTSKSSNFPPSHTNSDLSHSKIPTLFPPNIPRNRYKGRPRSRSPSPHPYSEEPPANSPSGGSPQVRIIGAAPFAQIIQEGGQAYQLHITPTLPEEHLWAEVPTPEKKSEDQILREVVPSEYHEFADVFSET